MGSVVFLVNLTTNMIMLLYSMTLVFFLVIIAPSCLTMSNTSSTNRKAKLFNIFQITNFPNSECTSSSGECGTCMTGSECSGQGGKVDGTCASGFGSCCLLYVDTCGGTISTNRTYIRNPGYPSTYTTAGTCTWTFEKCSSNICQIRLDYDQHTTAAPSNQGFCLTDTTEGNQVTGPNTPVHCGGNAGQHFYMDAGAYSTNSATLSKVLTGSTGRTWKIKVSMIECGSRALPPGGCYQYLTGVTGQVRSHNFNVVSSATYNHLRSQFYKVCVRREKRYCKIGWTQSSDPDSFKLSRDPGIYGSRVEGSCNPDSVQIPGGSNGGGNDCRTGNTAIATGSIDRYCGGTLNCWDNSETPAEVVSDIVPFRLGVSLNSAEGATSFNRGFCLNYRQILC